MWSPWHKSLSSGGPSSSLTFSFPFFQVIYSPSAENLVIQRPIIEIYPVIEEILALLSGNSFGVACQESYQIYPYLIQSCCTGSVYWIFSWSGKISNYKKCANMQVLTTFPFLMLIRLHSSRRWIHPHVLIFLSCTRKTAHTSFLSNLPFLEQNHESCRIIQYYTC